MSLGDNGAQHLCKIQDVHAGSRGVEVNAFRLWCLNRPLMNDYCSVPEMRIWSMNYQLNSIPNGVYIIVEVSFYVSTTW